MGITDDPYRISSPFHTAGEKGIVRQHSSNSCHDPPVLMPQALDMGSGCLSCDPFGSSGISGDLSVHGHGILHHYIGSSCTDIMEKYLIDLPAFFFQHMFLYLYTMLPENFQPPACHQGIGISCSHYYFPDTGLQDSLCAGRLFSIMAAGFQSYIHDPVFWRLAAVSQSVSLRMELTILFMPSFPDDPAVFYDDSSHHRIGRNPAFSFLCQFQGSSHKFFIFLCCTHVSYHLISLYRAFCSKQGSRLPGISHKKKP